MIETALVSTTVRQLNAAGDHRRKSSENTHSHSSASFKVKLKDEPSTSCHMYPDSPSKFHPIKVEFNSGVLDSCLDSRNNNDDEEEEGTRLAELKPLSLDYASSVNMSDTLLSSSSKGGLESGTVTPTFENFTRPQSDNNNNSTSRGGGGTNSGNSSNGCGGESSSSSSSADVTSTETSTPPGITKIETLDFTASQDAFDDLASIVGISMGADSTVDLDDWIENTAQKIKPLMGGEGGGTTLESLSSSIPPGVVVSAATQHALQTALARNNAAAAAAAALCNSQLASTSTLNGSPNTHSYLSLNSSGSGSTLQSLLQGSLLPPPPSQHNQSQLLGKGMGAQNPSGFSILHNRLTHGNNSGTSSSSSSSSMGNIVKVDSTFDLLKTQPDYASASYVDTLPHSTQSGANGGQVSTSGSEQNLLHRRLGELGSLAKLKSKQKIRNKPECNNGTGGSSSMHPAALAAANENVNGISDQGKKMMHHCQICNRGFLNKSNIKVHMRTHTGEKPFPCKHCSKTFRQKAHLLKHMSIHKRISRD